MSQDFSKYPAAQRAAYLGAIAALVTADREASEAEVQFLSALAQQTGLSQQDAQRVVDAAMDPDSGSLKRDLEVLKQSELRFSLMHDLVAFAQSDGDYNEAEQERVASMAKFLGISEEQQDAVDQYQSAAAAGEDPSELNGLMSRLGMPKGGGALAGLLATVGPMILQQIMSRGGGGAAGQAGAGGGGLGGLLGQVMGAMGGGGAGGAPAGGGMGGLEGILGQVMGAMGGGGDVPAQRGGGGAPSGMGGLGQILGVLGSMGGGGGGQPAPRGGGGGYDAVSGVLGRLFGR